MEVVRVIRYGLVQRREISVDQQVVMARVRAIRTGGRDAHTLQAEMDSELGLNDRSVLEIGKVNLGARSRRGRPSFRYRGYVDPLRHDRWRVGKVVLVTEQQLQRMRAGRQGDVRFGLTGAEVQVARIVRYRLVKRREIAVDDQ